MMRFTESADVRTHARAVLKSLTPIELGSMASESGKHLLGTILPPVVTSETGAKHPVIGLYRALPGEMDTDAWAVRLSGLGYQVAYPRVDASSPRGLRYHILPDADPVDGEWSLGSYGVREPQQFWTEVEPATLRAILIPGLAFGRGGERIGKGKGFYDRLLESLTGPIRIGVCPESLLFDDLPLRPWDQRMHIILTEAGGWDVSRHAPLKSEVAPQGQLR